MLVEQILSFFSTNSSSFNKEDLQDIRVYQNTDTIRDINWKKTATYDTLMTNTYEGEKNSIGSVILVANQNMKKGLYESTVTQYNELINMLTIATQRSQSGTIQHKIISTPPKIQDYQQTKQVIVSDFFRNNESFHIFLQACQKGLVKGVIPQLYTDTGPFFHPLSVQYPRYFLT